jgi:hypothetical protein
MFQDSLFLRVVYDPTTRNINAGFSFDTSELCERDQEAISLIADEFEKIAKEVCCEQAVASTFAQLSHRLNLVLRHVRDLYGIDIKLDDVRLRASNPRYGGY